MLRIFKYLSGVFAELPQKNSLLPVVSSGDTLPTSKTYKDIRREEREGEREEKEGEEGGMRGIPFLR